MTQVSIWLVTRMLRKFVVTRFVFDLLPYSCAAYFTLRPNAGAARHSEQREGWLEAKFDLDPAQLVNGSVCRKIAPSFDDFST